VQNSWTRSPLKRGIVKSISRLLPLALLLVCIVAMPASAHVLEYDGDIAAVLHINPDDDPVSDRPTSYVLYFTDESNRFTLPACNCTVSIKENGRTIDTQQLADSSLVTSTNNYTFSKPDVYYLVVTGKPIKSGTFQPFTLSYLIRVSSGNLSQQPFPPLLWVGLGSLMGLIVLGGFASEYSNIKDDEA